MSDFRYQVDKTSILSHVDQGLRSYMLGVYNLMALGVACTALVTLMMLNAPGLMQILATGPGSWIIMLALLGIGFFAPKMIFSGSAAMAHTAYWAYAVLWGVLLSPMIAVYLGQSPELVVRALGITALTFGSVSLVGYTTKRDLSGFSVFFTMASIGLLIAILANALFFKSSLMSLATSCFVVILFSAVTAYETQQIKEMYYSSDSSALAKRKSIFGAFILYGSFVTLFVHILNILGIMRSSE